MVSEVEPDPLAQLMEEARRPRTWNDIWAAWAEELRDQGHELDEDVDIFNLNTLNTKLEMK